MTKLTDRELMLLAFIEKAHDAWLVKKEPGDLVKKGLIQPICVFPNTKPEYAGYVYTVTDKGYRALREHSPERITNVCLREDAHVTAAHYVKQVEFEQLPQYLAHPNTHVRDAARLRYYELRHSWRFWVGRVFKKLGELYRKTLNDMQESSR